MKSVMEAVFVEVGFIRGFVSLEMQFNKKVKNRVARLET